MASAEPARWFSISRASEMLLSVSVRDEPEMLESGLAGGSASMFVLSLGLSGAEWTRSLLGDGESSSSPRPSCAVTATGTVAGLL